MKPIELSLISDVSISHLKTLDIETIKKQLPQFLIDLFQKLESQIQIEKIIAFGSRARGTNKPLSDWDLCFFVCDVQQWNALKPDIGEIANSLLKLDCVAWHEATPPLKEQILKEGFRIW